MALDISPRDSAYQTLRRAQTRSGTLFPDQTFPQSSLEIRGRLRDRALSAYDSADLARIPSASAGIWHWSDSARGNLFIAGPAVEASLAGGGAGDTLGSTKRVGLGGRLYGTVGGFLTWYTHAMVYTEKVGTARYTHQFDPAQGESYTVEKGAGDSLLDTRTYNRFEYYLRYDKEWWSIKAGRDWVHSGPGYFTSLTASRETPPYYLVEGRIDFAPWLRLDNYLLKMTDSSYDVQKYANLHRLEFRPLKTLALAYEDIVIYQDRDPDPAYLLPFVPLTFSEANSGGRDNASMSFDATWDPVPGLSLWGQLFLDDLLGPTSFFDDFWENRWASLAGFQWVLPLAWTDADLVVEYAHVEPWTYTGRLNHTSFKHYNVPSAARLGPDSRGLDVQVSWRPWKWLQWREHWEGSQKGTGRGATLGVIHDDSIDGQTKSFLENSLSSWRLSHELKGYYRRYLSATAWWMQAGANDGDRFGLNMNAEW